jgi:uncharacterized alpha-E superfamily protein
MLSRKAEALYWVGRYLERAEATARRFDVEYHSRLESELAGTATLPWHALLFSSGDETAYRERYGDEEERSLLHFLILDRNNPNSTRACVTAARENARGIRDLISSEMWEELNRFHLDLNEETLESLLRRTPHDLLQWVKRSCWLFGGITERTMTRGEGYQVLQCGKFLERAESTARLLDGKSYAMLNADAAVAGALDLHQWMALLKSVGAYEAFRKTQAGMAPTDIMAFVLLDALFPGSIRFSIAEVEAALRTVSNGDYAGPDNEALRTAGRLLATLVHARSDDAVGGLHSYLTRLVEECAALHHAIVRTYFSHLSWRPWEAEESDTRSALTAPGEWQALVMSAQQQQQ